MSQEGREKKTIKKRKLKKKYLISSLLLLALVVLLVVIGFYFKGRYDNMKKISSLYFEGLNETKEVGKNVNDVKYKLGLAQVINYPETGNKTIDSDILDNITSLEDDFSNEYGNDKEFTGMDEISYYQYIDYESYLGVDNTLSVVFQEAIESSEGSVLSEKNYTFNYSINTGDRLKDSYIFIGTYKKNLSNYLNKFLANDKDLKDSLLDSYKEEISENSKFNYIVTNDSLKVYFDKFTICPGSKGIVKVDVPYSELNSIMNIDVNKKTNKLKANVVKNKTTYTKSVKKMYVNSLVNFYKEDDKNSHLIGYINKGEVVHTLNTSDTGWTQITYGDKTGYVATSFLTDKKVAVEGFDTVDETVYAINNVNIRKTYDANSDKIGDLKKGDSIKRIGKSNNGWSEVEYNDNIAYINSSFLSTTKPSDEVPIKVNPQRGIDPNKPMVALTFDDGPNPISTPRIIATLAKYNAVGTFFDLGNLVERHPNVVKAEEAGGNEVGSHTYDHASLTRLDANGITNEINSSQNAFMKVLGHKVTLLRPPYGNVNDTVRNASSLALINWSIDTEDWKSRNKDKILEEFRCTNNYDGQIILMHSIYGTTADAVEVIVPELISKGYQLVTISEMAQYKGISLQTNKVYYHF